MHMNNEEEQSLHECIEVIMVACSCVCYLELIEVGGPDNAHVTKTYVKSNTY